MKRRGEDLTDLLGRWQGGDRQAADELFRAVYDELWAMARRRRRGERSETLDTGGLVHETYLRLADQRNPWASRESFFALAARSMRRVLVDRERRRRARKRAGEMEDVDPDELPWPIAEPAEVDLLDLDRALERLAEVDAGQARLVELRSFLGLTLEEAAEVQGCSRATAAREQRLARAFLRRELARTGPDRGVGRDKAGGARGR